MVTRIAASGWCRAEYCRHRPRRATASATRRSHGGAPGHETGRWSAFGQTVVDALESYLAPRTRLRRALRRASVRNNAPSSELTPGSPRLVDHIRMLPRSGLPALEGRRGAPRTTGLNAQPALQTGGRYASSQNDSWGYESGIACASSARRATNRYGTTSARYSTRVAIRSASIASSESSSRIGTVS